MKSIHVILLGLVVFNAMLVFTTTIGVFNYGGELYMGKNVTGIGGANFTSLSAETLFAFINPFAAGISLAIIAIAAILAWKVHSPIPLGVGALCGIYTGIWIQIYSTLDQFPIPAYLLGVGTIAMGLVLIIDVASMMAARQYG